MTLPRAPVAIVSAALLLVGSQPDTAHCEPTCDGTALGALAVDEGGLRIVKPSVANLSADDIVLQLNSHRLRGCADLERALDEARREELQIIVLLQRGADRRSEWIRDWHREAAIEPTAAAEPSFTPVPQATAPPALASAPSPEMPSARLDTAAARAELVRQLELGHELHRSLPVTSAGRWIRRIDELLEARPAHASLESLDRVSSYYATIREILAYRDKATAGRGAGRNRAGLTIEYGVGSEVTGWLERYPFLSESVLRPYDPRRSFMTGQRMGLWSPDDAVRLLVERAVSEGEQLEAQLSGSMSQEPLSGNR